MTPYEQKAKAESDWWRPALEFLVRRRVEHELPGVLPGTPELHDFQVIDSPHEDGVVWVRAVIRVPLA